MVWLKKIRDAIGFTILAVWEIVTWPYRKIRDEIKRRKKLKLLRERDPFIYK
jgi:hypothetical protein